MLALTMTSFLVKKWVTSLSTEITWQTLPPPSSPPPLPGDLEEERKKALVVMVLWILLLTKGAAIVEEPITDNNEIESLVSYYSVVGD